MNKRKPDKVILRSSMDGILWSRDQAPSILEQHAPKNHRSIKPLKSRQAMNKKLSKTSSKLQLSVFTVICVVLGIASYNLALGQWAIGIYALASLVFRVKSQTTFTLALMALVSVPLLTVLHNQTLADNFAVYAYLLLVVGVFSALLEQWRERPKATRKI